MFKTFADAVAKIIYQGMQKTARQEQIPITKVRKQINSLITASHPQQQYKVTFDVSVGDILQPTHEFILNLGDAPVHFTSDMLFMIYSLSSEKKSHYFSSFSDDEITEVKFVLIDLDCNLESLSLLNPNDVQGVLAYSTLTDLLRLIMHCRIVTNMGHLI